MANRYRVRYAGRWRGYEAIDSRPKKARDGTFGVLVMAGFAGRPRQEGKRLAQACARKLNRQTGERMGGA